MATAGHAVTVDTLRCLAFADNGNGNGCGSKYDTLCLDCVGAELLDDCVEE